MYRIHVPVQVADILLAYRVECANKLKSLSVEDADDLRGELAIHMHDPSKRMEHGDKRLAKAMSRSFWTKYKVYRQYGTSDVLKCRQLLLERYKAKSVAVDSDEAKMLWERMRTCVVRIPSLLLPRIILHSGPTQPRSTRV